MNSFTQKLAFLALTALCFCGSAFAQDNAQPADGSPNPSATPAGEHKMYIGVLGGASMQKFPSFNTVPKTTQINFGAHIGIDTYDLNFAKLGFGFQFDNFNIHGASGVTDTPSFASILGQVLLHHIANGLNVGLEGGFAIVGFGNVDTDVYEYGAFVGYDIPITKEFSVGPEVHFDRTGPGSIGLDTLPVGNNYKFLAALNYYFD